MSNVIDIYLMLKRIESNNHMAKMKDIYSDNRRWNFYRLKTIEINNVIKRIKDTKPHSINYYVEYQFYNNIDTYLITFVVLQNNKYHLPNRIFKFHLPTKDLKILN